MASFIWGIIATFVFIFIMGTLGIALEQARIKSKNIIVVLFISYILFLIFGCSSSAYGFGFFIGSLCALGVTIGILSPSTGY
jgi:hypothetical protein